MTVLMGSMLIQIHLPETIDIVAKIRIVDEYEYNETRKCYLAV